MFRLKGCAKKKWGWLAQSILDRKQSILDTVCIRLPESLSVTSNDSGIVLYGQSVVK